MESPMATQVTGLLLKDTMAASVTARHTSLSMAGLIYFA
jgi:hypothetical protein